MQEQIFKNLADHNPEAARKDAKEHAAKMLASVNKVAESQMTREDRDAIVEAAKSSKRMTGVVGDLLAPRVKALKTAQNRAAELEPLSVQNLCDSSELRLSQVVCDALTDSVGIRSFKELVALDESTIGQIFEHLPTSTAVLQRIGEKSRLVQFVKLYGS